MVTLTVAGGRVARAEARSDRPRIAGRLFDGRAAGEAEPLAGALFAICGRAQSIAAATAVEQALGRAASEPVRLARETRLAAEAAQEHLGRLLVDWPRLAGLETAVKAYARARALLSPLLASAPGATLPQAALDVNEWAQSAVFGVSPADFLSLDSVNGFANWVRGAGTSPASLALAVLERHARLGASDTAFLGTADASMVESLAAHLDADPAFDDAPHWQGQPRETGALARMASHPLVADAVETFGPGLAARLVARLLETAAALGDLRTGRGSRQGGAKHGDFGLGWAETARGLLVHRTRVEGDRLAGYRIVAPTEWNFHPEGAFVRGAAGLADDGALEAAAHWIVGSLDPCVGVRCEVIRA